MHLTSQNGQIQFKNYAANAARLLTCAWPFWNLIHLRVKTCISVIKETLKSFDWFLNRKIDLK